MSERSGNRGACSQPCRLTYDLVDESGRTVVKGRHLLSVRDLNLSDRIGELIDAGITSFKIEGRLKDVGYIKNVVSHYRQRIDRELASRPGFCRSSVGESRPDFQPDPSKSFTRGESEYFFDGRRAGVASFDTPKAVGEFVGRVARVDGRSFTLAEPHDLAPGDGICFRTRNGLAGTNVNEVAGNRIVPNRMEGVVPGAEVFRNFDRRFSLALDRSRTRRVIPVRADAAITPQRVTVRFTDCEGVAAEVTRDGVFEPAKDSRKMLETVAAQLSRSGDTIFDVREVRSEGCDRFVPVSLLAELRREGLERLRRARLDRPVVHAILPEDRSAPYPSKVLAAEENVTNRLAEEFYRDHGVRQIARGLDLEPATAGHPVMRSAERRAVSGARPVPIPAPVRLCPVRDEPDRRERSKITKGSRASDWPERSCFFGGGSCGRVPFLLGRLGEICLAHTCSLQAGKRRMSAVCRARDRKIRYMMYDKR